MGFPFAFPHLIFSMLAHVFFIFFEVKIELVFVTKPKETHPCDPHKVQNYVEVLQDSIGGLFLICLTIPRGSSKGTTPAD